MRPSSGRPDSARRLFLLYAALSLLPIAVLGLVLASSYRAEARSRGLAEGRAEADLLARSAVQPVFADTSRLGGALPMSLRMQLNRLVADIVPAQAVRLRIRNLSGNVVFTENGQGMRDVADDEVLDALKGETILRLTRLNTDANDTGPAGPRVVEVYRPLLTQARQIGVLELYLPYAPIQHDVTAGMSALYHDLAGGLGLLYIVLAAISYSVTRRLRRQAAANAYLAEHDLLTGLPNRAQFHRRIQAALDAGRPVAVALLDLDRFKEVNDSLGHHNGDTLLTELAWRLSADARPIDVIARLGGDEFGVLLGGVSSADDATAALYRLRQLVEGEVDVAGLPVTVEASVGYALSPVDGLDADSLMQRADIALHVAKRSNAGVVRYNEANDAYDASQLSLVAELRRALTNDELVLHYQPKASVATGEVLSVEALVRWEHPSRGLLYPVAFLPVVEQTGLIDDLTAWVLRRALSDLASWGSSVGSLAVAVNVSGRNVSRSDFAVDVLGALAESGVLASRLIVELTETALVVDPVGAASVLGDLHAAGVRVSVDDFGQGQTSLSYLSQLPLSEVKIDMSFVRDMLERPAHAAIVQSVIDLAHNLGFAVVAEGVETVEVLDALRTMGCDLAQGYLIGRPSAPMPHALVSWSSRGAVTHVSPR